MITVGYRRNKSRLHDAGVATFYRVERDETAPPPNTVQLVEIAAPLFRDREVGSSRFYEAAQVNRRVDRLVEIWQDRRITTRDICKIDERFYLIVQTAQGEDEDGILVTRLSLEETDGSVWEGALYAVDSQH